MLCSHAAVCDSDKADVDLGPTHCQIVVRQILPRDVVPMILIRKLTGE